MEEKKVKIKNSTPSRLKFFRSRERVLIPNDRTHNIGRNAAKRQQRKGIIYV